MDADETPDLENGNKTNHHKKTLSTPHQMCRIDFNDIYIYINDNTCMNHEFDCSEEIDCCSAKYVILCKHALCERSDLQVVGADFMFVFSIVC